MATLEPVDFDPFSGGQSAAAPVQRAVVPEGVTRVTVGPNTGVQFIPVDDDPFAGPSMVDQATGLAKAAGTGLAKGTLNAVGLTGDLRQALSTGVDFAADKLGIPKDKVQQFKELVLQGARLTPARIVTEVPTSAELTKGAQELVGEFHKPQNRAERYVETAAEFVPAAMATAVGGGVPAMLRAGAMYGVLPGLASEAAGQVTEGSKLEPWARAGAALVAGGGVAALDRPSTVGGAVRSYMSPNVTPDTIARATSLMDDAAARGVNLTWAEAIERVAPGSGMTDLQRVVESSRGGREVMAPFFAQRPAQVRTAARNSFDEIGPVSADPSNIGREVGQTAQGIVDDVQGAVNRASRPYYQAAENVRVGPQVHAAMMDDPLFARTLQEIRTNPALNRTVENLPDDSVGVIDLVQRRMREQAENLRLPGQANTSNLAAANYQDARNIPLQVADTATGSRPGIAGSYETARNMQQQMRAQYLEPLMSGPIGRMASADATTQRTIKALFPEKPLPNSQDEVRRSVAAMSARAERPTRQLVRAYIEGVFNTAAKNLQTGPNQFGGAKFVNRLVGDEQQRQNVRAAVEALGANGDRVWRGFSRLLDILEATGTRQAVGSKTSFNTRDLAELSSGNIVGNAVKTGAAPVKWLSVISDTWSRWQLQGNLRGIGGMLVDPRSRSMLVRLSSMPRDGAAAQIMAARIAAAGWNAANKPDRRNERQGTSR